MKKLMIAIVFFSMSTAAFADDTNGLYIRADAGGAFDVNRKVTIINRLGGGDMTLKNKLSATADFGLGYNISDEFRAELIVLHRFNPTMSGSSPVTIGGVTFTRHSKSKAKIDALIIRSYFDLYNFGVGKLFAGAGVGIAQVSRKGSFSIIRSGSTISSGSFNHKKKNNLAYSLAVGAGFKVKEGINLDIQYNWSDFGSAKGSSVKYRGHSVMGGVRVDL